MDKFPPECQQLNSCFNFIKPSIPDDLKKKENQGTFSSSHATISASMAPINNDNSSETLHINTDPLRISYSPPVHDDKIDNAIFHQLNFPYTKISLISLNQPNASTTSSSTILAQTPVAIPNNNDAIDSNSSFTNKSPAASFLANFMSPITTTSNLDTSQQSEKPKVIENYALGECIGFGGFSTVHKAQHVKTGQIVAVKIIQHQLMNVPGSRGFDRELSIWRSLDHPNIVHLQKVVHKDDEQVSYLFNDFCSGGNLINYLNKCKQIKETVAKRLFKELCQGIHYLHIERRVCHKDLKLDNILLDNDGHIKICDFGMAIQIPRHQYRYSHKKTRTHADEVAGGSLAYAAPEQIRQKIPLACPKTDIWSLGVILYALMLGSLPFMDDYDLRLQQKILEDRFKIPEDIVLSDALKELICACLAYEPKKRFDINQILQSTWINT
ncbi:kinase-like domain-containing protein [Parasitella parasitica]|nr:kinase-like domain-containing protein [Parasitella parasitica]